ncbi:hypothetical protein [Streptacidiphilus sp. ASG 303]|uniref:hypothetical protein n=1 Tax=Streptomycetaceae TaxID=2062 RepID=UPI001E510F64|nr:hypothetical protein [Streptacidiphilus sp. ASG 303]MCD0482459.1 hypothetical protein [Streptacidiphilus sp. ASG 303]
MSRFRTPAALAVAALLTALGPGSAPASAAPPPAAGRGSAGSAVVGGGWGNLVGPLQGDAAGLLQTATGSQASDQGNTAAVDGRSGTVGSVQGNGNVTGLLPPAAPN